jgi:transposase
MLARASQMAQLRRQGKSTAEVAELFHVSKRTVQRVLSSFKATGGVRSE